MYLLCRLTFSQTTLFHIVSFEVTWHLTMKLLQHSMTSECNSALSPANVAKKSVQVFAVLYSKSFDDYPLLQKPIIFVSGLESQCFPRLCTKKHCDSREIKITCTRQAFFKRTQLKTKVNKPAEYGTLLYVMQILVKHCNNTVW